MYKINIQIGNPTYTSLCRVRVLGVLADPIPAGSKLGYSVKVLDVLAPPSVEGV